MTTENSFMITENRFYDYQNSLFMTTENRFMTTEFRFQVLDAFWHGFLAWDNLANIIKKAIFGSHKVQTIVFRNKVRPSGGKS